MEAIWKYNEGNHFVGSQWLRFRRKKKTKPLISTVLKGSHVRTLRLTFSNRLWAALNSNGFKQTLKCFPEGRPEHLGRSYVMASFTFIINPSTRGKLFFHLSAPGRIGFPTSVWRAFRGALAAIWSASADPRRCSTWAGGGPARIRPRHRGPHALPFTAPLPSRGY